MYELNEITEYFNSNLNWILTDERIEELYNLISNPHLRVNSQDKKWVAFVTQASEDVTVLNAIEKIYNTSFESPAFDRQMTEGIINDVGNIFISNEIRLKHRIPFYILVLDYFLEE